MKSNLTNKKRRIDSLFLYCYLSILFFEPQNFLSVLREVRISYVFAIISLMVVFFSTSREHLLKLTKSKLFIFLSIFTILCMISNMISDLEKDVDAMGPVKVYVLFILVALSIKEYKDITRLIIVLLFLGLVNTTVTIYNYHIGNLPTRIYSYLGSLGPSGSNEYALIMLQLLSFSIYILLAKNSKFLKRFSTFSSLSFVYCITRTRSRAGFIGLVIFLLFNIKKIFQDKKTALIFVFISVIILAKTPSSYFERITTIFKGDAYVEDTNITSRFDVYKQSLNVIIENPFLGVGTGNYLLYTNANPHIRLEKEFTVHNSFLLIAAENGILAMTFFVIILLKSLTMLKEKNDNFAEVGDINLLLRSLKISIICYLWMALTIPIQFSRILFIVLAISLRLNQIYDSSVRTKLL